MSLFSANLILRMQESRSESRIRKASLVLETLAVVGMDEGDVAGLCLLKERF